MVLPGTRTGGKSARSGGSATTRIRLNDNSNKTMSGNNGDRRRNNAATPIDRLRISSSDKLKSNAVPTRDRHKSSSEDKAKTNSGRTRSSDAGSISNVRTRNSKGVRLRNSDATLTSNVAFERKRTDAGSTRSDKQTNNDATPNFSDEISDRKMGADLIASGRLTSSYDVRMKNSAAGPSRTARRVTIKTASSAIKIKRGGCLIGNGKNGDVAKNSRGANARTSFASSTQSGNAGGVNTNAGFSNKGA